MKKILSIDGGGIRGVIPAVILMELEKRTGKKIAEMFDMIAGTSTGGIIALALTTLDETGSVQYTAKEILDMYIQNGDNIFKKSLGHSLKSLGGLASGKYSSGGIDGVLTQYFGETLMQNSYRPTMVTSYDIMHRKPTFFKSWRVEYFGVKKADAARCTSAAPTFFEPKKLVVGDKKCSFIDGGVFVNNPSMSVYTEARMMWPDEEIYVVSLGTGEASDSIKHEDAIHWGAAQWVVPLLDIMFDGQSDAADYQMFNLLQMNYVRLQAKLSFASHSMDDVSEKNMDALIREGEYLIESQTCKLDDIIRQLTIK